MLPPFGVVLFRSITFGLCACPCFAVFACPFFAHFLLLPACVTSILAIFVLFFSFFFSPLQPEARGAEGERGTRVRRSETWTPWTDKAPSWRRSCRRRKRYRLPGGCCCVLRVGSICISIRVVLPGVVYSFLRRGWVGKYSRGPECLRGVSSGASTDESLLEGGGWIARSRLQLRSMPKCALGLRREDMLVVRGGVGSHPFRCISCKDQALAPSRFPRSWCGPVRAHAVG